MSEDNPNVDDLLADAYAYVYGMDPDSEAYQSALNSITKLEAIKDTSLQTQAAIARQESQDRTWWRPSGDAMLGAAASVIGILTIVHAEQLYPVASKALSIATRIRP
jgi:hypothetical protein|nr:MAG TPA: hypothetical protein [Caudoviricetes sp.]